MESTVTVRLFAALRDRVGHDHIAVPLPPGRTAGDVLATAVRLHPVLAPFAPYVRVSVNARYVAMDAPITEADDIAFISPVSGG